MNALINLSRLGVICMGIVFVASMALLSTVYFVGIVAAFAVTNRVRVEDAAWFLVVLSLQFLLSATATIFIVLPLAHTLGLVAVDFAFVDMWLAIVLAIGGPGAVAGSLVGRVMSERRIRRLQKIANLVRASSAAPCKFVLYLRPFKLDQVVVSEFNTYFSNLNEVQAAATGLVRLGLGTFDKPRSNYMFDAWIERLVTTVTRHHPMNSERVLADALAPVGTLLAVGLTKGLCTGAARIVCGNDTWQEEVADLASRAILIVFIPGVGVGSQWEIEHIATRYHEKTMFIMPPGALKHSDADRIGDEWVEAARSLAAVNLRVPLGYNNSGGAYWFERGALHEHDGLSFFSAGRLRKTLSRIANRLMRTSQSVS